MSKVLCIYHGNCADGFGAAWVVRKALGVGVDWHPGVYGNSPPDVRNRDVVMVDFSYKRPVLESMIGGAGSLLVLDHHKTASADLDGLPQARADWGMHYGYLSAPGVGNVGVLFDMERSGAGITWDYFFPGKPRPKLLDHIEDRDLWRFKLAGTREIQAAVFSHPYDFALWDDLMSLDPQTLRGEGEAIERKHHKDIAELVGVMKRFMNIGGYRVPVANLPYTLTSDAGALMSKGEPFAACYWDTPDGRVFSLRSTDSGMDVSLIAKAYGGGGHAQASGFRMPIGWEGDNV